MKLATVIRVVQKLTAPMHRRVRIMVSRAVVELIDDAKKMQVAQVSVRADELRDDVERFQSYGFTSVPSPGAEGVLLAVGGNSDHGVLVVVDDRRYRPKGLAEGEVCLYDKTGTRITLKANGDVEIVPSSGVLKVTADVEVDGDISTTGNVEVTGDVDVTGKVDADGNVSSDGTVTGATDVVGGGKSLKSHTHSGSTLTTTATVDTGPVATISGNTGAPT